MKYQLLIIKNLFLKKFLKWIIIYLSLILLDIYLIYFKIKTPMFSQDDINILFGVSGNNLNILGILILLFNIFLTIYFIYSIYNYEYNSSYEFISLRISNNKRNLFKLLVLSIFIISLRIFYYLIIYLIFFKYYEFNIIIFFKNIYIYLIITIITFLVSHLSYLIKSN